MDSQEPSKPLVVFCQKCKGKILVPVWLRKGNIKGKLRLKCPVKNCTGHANLKMGKVPELIPEVD